MGVIKENILSRRKSFKAGNNGPRMKTGQVVGTQRAMEFGIRRGKTIII